jgi:hypothetical protein
LSSVRYYVDEHVGSAIVRGLRRGVVYAPQGAPVGAIIGGLLLIYNVLSAEEMMDSVEYI